MRAKMSSLWTVMCPCSTFLISTLLLTTPSLNFSEGGLNSEDALNCLIGSGNTIEELEVICEEDIACFMKLNLSSSYRRLHTPILEYVDHCRSLINSGVTLMGKTDYFSQYAQYNRTMKVHLIQPWPFTYHCALSNLFLTSLTNCANSTSDRCSRPKAQRCLCSIQHMRFIGYHFRALMRDEFCSFYNLETLLMKQTQIVYIDKDAFASLRKLRELRIQSSYLKSLPGEIFLPLQSLEMLILENNVIYEGEFPNLSQMQQLMVIHLDNNNIRSLENVSHCNGTSPISEFYLVNDHLTRLHKEPFLCMKRLKKLNFDNNSIHEITAGFFYTMNSDVNISLRNNSLLYLPYTNFSTAHQIQNLNLSNNHFTSMPYLRSTSLAHLDLSHNEIRGITLNDRMMICFLYALKSLNISNNGIANLPAGAFRCNTNSTNIYGLLNHTDYRKDSDSSSIHSLDLSSNRLNSFHCGDFSDRLVTLFLSSNQIETFNCSEALFRPMSLRYLDLSSNRLRNLTSIILPQGLENLLLSNNKIDIFSFPKRDRSSSYLIPHYLKWIDLRSNPIQILCPLWGNYKLIYSDTRLLMCECKEINLRKNVFTDVEQRWKMQCFYSFQNAMQQNEWGNVSCSHPLNGSCECYAHNTYYSSCDLPCPDQCSCHINPYLYTYFVNCSGYYLSQMPYMPSLLNVYMILEFSRNRLKKLTSEALISFLWAIGLYLQNNELVEIASDSFWNVTQLQFLNLESNLLEKLPLGVFTPLVHLKELNLAKNRLKHLPIDMVHFLQSLSTVSFKNTSSLGTSALATQNHNWKALSYVKLGNNPWNCDCDLLKDILNGGKMFHKVVKDAGMMHCYNEMNVGPLPLLSFFEMKCLHSDVTVLSSTVSVMSFLVLMTILTFIYRHELQVLLYYHTSFRFFKQNLGDIANKRYDAFVAHSGDDMEFVALQLIPGLEKIERPYRVCIHDRDFLAGSPIMDNIQKAVECSLCTLVVLTDNFVRSHWCTHEFKTAHRQMALDQNSRLIVIVVDKIPSNVPSELDFYLNSNTYLKWKDKLFWKKLYFAMPHQRIADMNSKLVNSLNV